VTAGDTHSLVGQWHFTHNDYHFAPHWFKIYVLMALLPKFEWVILVDDDSVFQNMSLPLEALTAGVGDHWWIMPDVPGITSHTLIFRNTPCSIPLISYLWDLRRVCPSCPAGEQCAVHLLLHQLLVDHLYQEGVRALYINDDWGRQCCNPAEHCEFPQGFVYKPNPAHGVVLQGCVWHWWMAANATGTMARHQHIKWVSAPNGIMPTNTLHRIKMKIACTNHHRTFDEEWQPRRWWSRDLVLEMERRPNATSRGPPWSPAQHTCGSGSAVACRSATTASSRTTHPSPLILCLLCEVPRPPSSLLLSRAGNSGPHNT